jgi:hypothetical protein
MSDDLFDVFVDEDEVVTKSVSTAYKVTTTTTTTTTEAKMYLKNY